MAVESYIYSEENGEQYLVGPAISKVIERWFEYWKTRKEELTMIVQESDVYVYSNDPIATILLDEQDERISINKEIQVSMDDLIRIDPYDKSTEYYDLVQQYYDKKAGEANGE